MDFGSNLVIFGPIFGFWGSFPRFFGSGIPFLGLKNQKFESVKKIVFFEGPTSNRWKFEETAVTETFISNWFFTPRCEIKTLIWTNINLNKTWIWHSKWTLRILQLDPKKDKFLDRPKIVVFWLQKWIPWPQKPGKRPSEVKNPTTNSRAGSFGV